MRKPALYGSERGCTAIRVLTAIRKAFRNGETGLANVAQGVA
jgi:hypothetical protein